jgi:hypothetical protein
MNPHLPTCSCEHADDSVIVYFTCRAAERAKAAIHHAVPFDGVYGGMLEAVAIAEGRAKAVRPGFVRLLINKESSNAAG